MRHLTLWAALLVGCVLDDDPFDGRGEPGTSCNEDLDCDVGSRCDGTVCTTGCVDDDECEGVFACGVPWDEATGADGCYERCAEDLHCKAGYVCGRGGDCVAA
ncbi:MAG: hypothetical protein R3F59_31570 [Myxococcota bacterium]